MSSGSDSLFGDGSSGSFRFGDEDNTYEEFMGTQFPLSPPDLPVLIPQGDLNSFPGNTIINTIQGLSENKTPGANKESSSRELINMNDSTVEGFSSQKRPGRQPRPAKQFVILDDAEIIDLESAGFPIPYSSINHWSCHADLVKAEGQRAIIVEDVPRHAIKEEAVERFGWQEMGTRMIELSDSEDENTLHKLDAATPSSILAASDTIMSSLKASSFGAGLPTLSTKARRPILDREMLLRAQKALVSRASGKRMSNTGAIFKSAQPPSQPLVEDENAWMKSNMEFEKDAAAIFADLKSKFKSKKRAGRLTWEDDIAFLKAETIEKARLKRLKLDYEQIRGPVCRDSEDLDDNLESDNELFISEAQGPSMKRRHQVMVETEDDEPADAELVDDERDPNKLAKPMSKRRHAKEKEAEEEASMRVGIEEYLEKRNKLEERKARASKKSPESRMSHKKSLRGERKPEKGSKKKAAPKKSKVKKSKADRASRLNDIGSLLGSNIYEDANRNLERADFAVVTSKRKNEVLKALLAGVPLEDQREARGHQADILRSSKILGKGKVFADGKGRWKLKGMASSLWHHQVQGSAWMRERELQDIEPRGGLQADGMGLGKTVMMIALMVANPPSAEDSKCTLIVCNPSLTFQWMKELRTHAELKVFPRILRYQASTSTETFGDDCEAAISTADVVLTTYQEVLRSYPKYKPPGEILPPEKREEWWKKVYKENRNLLHRVHFYRVVLDEAQAIKNHRSQTSKACRGLMAKHRWALSGTPIQNAVEELFPYFKFLRVPQTGSYEVFKENFCDAENDKCTPRLHTMLKRIMIRRTHKNTLFGAPIVKLPKNSKKTYWIEFNPVERAIYEAVRNRYIQHINNKSQAGTLEKSYRNVLTMLLRLRQLTAHPFMLQETIENLFEMEDVEKLWEKTASEVTADDTPAKDMVATMRKMIAAKGEPEPGAAPPPSSKVIPAENTAEEVENTPLVFKFRRYLRSLAKNSKWTDLKDRSLCHKCRDVPDEPYVTDCFHLYCKECLNAMALAATEKGEYETACLECGIIFKESRPCVGLVELDQGDDLTAASPGASPRTRRDPDQDIKWINMGGRILPSSKTAAVQAQVEIWLRDEPEKKIIIFSQFHMFMRILERVCQTQEWKYCTYHGKMKQLTREKAIASFREDPEVKIMIASLKCGGVGLNLTMASRVICVDLWWNQSVEQQAFCRVFRIGQDSETFITRLVVKNTVDEKLQEIQDEKEKAIGAAIDDNTMLEKLSLQDLMGLFGPVTLDDNRKPFILVDDEGEYEGLAPRNWDHPDGEEFGLPPR